MCLWCYWRDLDGLKISAAENSNKFQTIGFWKEDMVKLGPMAQATLVFSEVI
jgi:hypothetical protein